MLVVKNPPANVGDIRDKGAISGSGRAPGGGHRNPLCLAKAMVFPVVMYGYESWTVKKAEHVELMLLNCGVGEDCCESLGLQGDPTSPS